MILASNNAHKLDEFRAIFADMGIEIVPQSAAGCDFEVDETGDTFDQSSSRGFIDIYGLQSKLAAARDVRFGVNMGY